LTPPFVSRPARRAFTLIDLLVVVAIIGLLAAILFPVFFSARERVRQSACLSNYHQIGLAIHMRASDFDDVAPSNGGSFAGLIADCGPYTHNARLFACPNDFDRLKKHRDGSYRMASLYQGLPLSCGWHDPYTPAVTARHATTPLAYEAEQDFGQSAITPTYRHGGGTQILLFDRHARWIKGAAPRDADD